MLKSISNYWRESLLRILLIVILCGFSYIALWASIVITGDTDLSFAIPVISPWIHSSLAHFIGNLIPIFVLILHEKNQFRISKLILIPIIIDVFFLPLTLFGINPVIGLSKFVFFLFARFMLAERKDKLIYTSIFVFIITLEVLKIGSSDLISHEGHIFGSMLGIISLAAERYGLLKRI